VFSARLRWDNPENALAALERQKRAAGAPLIDLTESNPTRVGLPYPESALREALAPPGVHHYAPAPRGLASARLAVAREYRRAGHDVDAEQIVLTASSSESYAFLFKLLCDPGDAVLVPEPSYPLFEYLARLEGVRPVGYRLAAADARRGDWPIDFASLEAARARAAEGGVVRAVVVVNPNNPTGSFIDAGDLARLAEFCRAADLTVISDEVFASYRLHGEASDNDGDADGDRGDPAGPCLAATPELTRTTPVFSLGGLSKASGLPQLKLGWIVAGGPAAARQSALARLELIADTYLSVGTPVQLALPRLLEIGQELRRAIRRRLLRNRVRLRAALPADSPCTLLGAQGGWTAILRVPALASGTSGAETSDERWAVTLLRDDDVLVHPGYLYDMPAGAYLVVSLLPEPALFAAGITRVIARCGEFVP
jgi:alanine-synthesizing transaminase